MRKYNPDMFFTVGGLERNIEFFATFGSQLGKEKEFPRIRNMVSSGYSIASCK
jgi:hypothetical protein